MKMEHQVVSFGLSNQLKEMGLPQNGSFAWYQYKNKTPYVNLKNAQNYCDDVAVFHDGYAECPKEICDAPTIAELGEMLKYRLQSFYEDHDGEYHISTFGRVAFFADKKEADARAKMWIYLKTERITK